MRLRWLGLALVVGCLPLGYLPLGCAASDNTGGTSANDTTSGSGGSGASGGSVGSGIGGNFGSGGAGGGSNGLGCSADLKSVTDSQGEVVEQCSPDLACLNGECVPLCQAAGGTKGSIGCEFWLPRPEFRTISHCYTAFVVNPWEKDANLTVKYGGAELSLQQIGRIPKGYGASVTYEAIPATGLPSGQVAVLFLAGSCSPQAGVPGDTLLRASGRNTAFDIVSDTPVKLYDLCPYASGGSAYLPGAALIYPRTAWGDNYVALVPHAAKYGEQWLQLVGTEDGTTVKVKPPIALPSGVDVVAAPANQVTTYTLNEGEVLQWYEVDATSTVIEADKPIGAFAGNVYLGAASATTPEGGADEAHQQIPYVQAMGSEYVAGGVVTRLLSLAPESVLYRIMGMVDGTQLTFDPPLAGAPTVLDQGQVVEFETTEHYVVRSQDDDHPFALSHYMSGAAPAGQSLVDCTPGVNNENNENCGLGDEDWVMVLPSAQFLDRYVFFVDPTYSVTNVVVTRKKDSDGFFADVDIACLGTIDGWMAVDDAGDYEVAHVDLARNRIGVTEACETSVHEVSSEGPFGITVWGTDYYASYGYPAGGNFASVNDVIVDPEVN